MSRCCFLQPKEVSLTQTRMTLSLPPLNRRLPALCNVRTLPLCPRSTLHSQSDVLRCLRTSVHVCAGTDTHMSGPAYQNASRLKQGTIVDLRVWSGQSFWCVSKPHTRQSAQRAQMPTYEA